jgi:UDP-glucose 4,6-dehydratase
MGDSDVGYTPSVILLTGGAGFIGSHVVIRLVQNYPQYTIINFDKLDYVSCLKNLESVASLPNYHFVKGDIRNPDMVNYVMRTHNVDTVMHFAAETHVDNSFGNSFVFTQTNVMGTHVLLEASKKHGIRRFVHVSTDEVYGEGNALDEAPEGSSEMRKLEPTNPYAASKAAAEMIANSYMRSFGFPLIITRGNNVYGPHQYPEKLIPKFSMRLMRDMPLCIHGDGSNTRNYLFATDAARAFDIILHKGVVGEVYNVGSPDEISNLDVAKKLLEIFDKADRADELLQHVVDRPFNDLRYPLERAKLAGLGWEPKVTWEDGLRMTSEWYKSNGTNWGNCESALVAHPRRGMSFDGTTYP